MSQPSRARFKSRPPPQTWMREIDMELRILKGKVPPKNAYLVDTPRYGTTDHWIQESIKRLFNSGLFWPVRAAEKKIHLP
jgi:hypothetical protein